MKKSLIVISGLYDFFNQNVAKILSEKLGMFLLDLKKLVAFELAEKEDIIEKCGLDYYLNLEKKTIKNAATYENTIVMADYDLFTYRQNHRFFQNTAVTIYLRFTKNNLKNQNNVDNINMLAFTERDKSLKAACDITINLSNENAEQASEKIIGKLKEVLL